MMMSTMAARLLAALALIAVWAPVVLRKHGGSPRNALLATLAVGLAWIAYRIWARRHALRVIREHEFPAFLRDKLRAAHPHLGDAQARQVERGLRQFFRASASAGGRFVAMPSKVVDTLWHEYILHTRGYERFCRRAFGRMLHHTPAEAMAAGAARTTTQRAGLRRAWYWSCKDEGVDPHKPSRLPLLFALDGTLAIAGGYVYAADCSLLGPGRDGTYCGTDFGCGSSCGSSDVSAGDGSGDGGDGGGGDGGGGGCGGD